jgi:endonuclease/exonuclease/phosphatase family metal-dependent hydrolase
VVAAQAGLRSSLQPAQHACPRVAHPPALLALPAAQAQQLAQHVAAAHAAAPAGPAAAGVLVMGDFNTTPGSPTCCELERQPGLGLQSIWSVPWADGAASGNGSALGSSGGAAAAAAAGGGTAPPDAEPEFTTWKFRTGGESRRVIDFVYFGAAALAPSARWRMLSGAEVGPQGLPCAAYPSDHQAVLAAFDWLSPPTTGPARG